MVGKLTLPRPIARYGFRDDLQALVEKTGVEPKPSGLPGSAEWRRSLRQLSRFWATQPKYYLEMEPDGSFRIPDVPPGEYLLQLAATEPPDPDAYDPLGNPVIRRPLGKSSIPVTVAAGASGDVQDLGVLTLPLNSVP